MIALVGTVLLACVGLLFFAVETALAVVWFPLCAATSSRSWLRSNWPGTYPQSLKWFFSPRDGREEYETKTVPTWFGLSSEQVKEFKGLEVRGGLRLIRDMWLWVSASD